MAALCQRTGNEILQRKQITDTVAFWDSLRQRIPPQKSSPLLRLLGNLFRGCSLARLAHGLLLPRPGRGCGRPWRPLTVSLSAGGASLPRHEAGGQQEGGAARPARRRHLSVKDRLNKRSALCRPSPCLSLRLRSSRRAPRGGRGGGRREQLRVRGLVVSEASGPARLRGSRCRRRGAAAPLTRRVGAEGGVRYAWALLQVARSFGCPGCGGLRSPGLGGGPEASEGVGWRQTPQVRCGDRRGTAVWGTLLTAA